MVKPHLRKVASFLHLCSCCLFSESIFTLCNVNDHVKQVFKSWASLWFLKIKACTAMIKKQQICVDFDKLVVLITLCGNEFNVSLDVTCKNISLCRFLDALLNLSKCHCHLFYYSLHIIHYFA